MIEDHIKGDRKSELQNSDLAITNVTNVTNIADVNRGQAHRVYALLQNDSYAIAKNKLDRIFNDDFKYFAIRYVNFRQYEQYLNEGYSDDTGMILQAEGEACGFVGQTVHEFFREHSSQWVQSIKDHTDFPVSTYGVQASNEFTELFDECMRKAKVQKDTDKSLRQSTMCLFQQKLMEQIDKGVELSDISELKLNPFVQLRRIMSHASGKPMSIVKMAKFLEHWDIMTEERIETMHRFFYAPETMTKVDIRSLREIMTNTKVSVIGMRGEQYHIALLFDPDVLESGKDNLNCGSPAPGQKWWSRMKERSEEHILVAILLINDRKMVERVVEDSRSSGKLAHPVIDFKGRVRYPNVAMTIA